MRLRFAEEFMPRFRCIEPSVPLRFTTLALVGILPANGDNAGKAEPARHGALATGAEGLKYRIGNQKKSKNTAWTVGIHAVFSTAHMSAFLVQ